MNMTHATDISYIITAIEYIIQMNMINIPNSGHSVYIDPHGKSNFGGGHMWFASLGVAAGSVFRHLQDPQGELALRAEHQNEELRKRKRHDLANGRKDFSSYASGVAQ